MGTSLQLIGSTTAKWTSTPASFTIVSRTWFWLVGWHGTSSDGQDGTVGSPPVSSTYEVGNAG